jgi:putative ABC transport system substrate-binding protein
MRRRDFIKIIGCGATSLPFPARAQKSAMPVVIYLSPGTPDGDARPAAAFVKGLAETGYEDGKSVQIQYRWANNQYDRLPSIAADLVSRQVAVIAAASTPAARAAKAATTTIPIVFTSIADPVQIGFVASLNRPGGNVTGVTLLSVEVGPKLLEMLHGAVPSATTFALLLNPANPNAENQSKTMQDAGLKLGLKIHLLNASVQRDFDGVFTKARELKAGGLIVGQDVFFNAEIQHLAELTVRYSLPAIYPQPEFAEAGGLMSYGASRSDAWRQAGIYVGRILKGEKAAELPVVQSSKFEFIVNLKTAKALGIEFHPQLLATADSVIE